MSRPVKSGNPVARQRWNRFRRHRRAYASAWVLLLLLLLSLGADLLCNDLPLYIRHNGKNYFPFLRDYSESTFLADGKFTAPDYRSLAATPAFAEESDNRIIFAPIPYGALTVADSARIRKLGGIPVTLTPVPRVGSVNVATNLTITRATAAASFFPTQQDDLRHLRVTDYWDLPREIRQGIATRFRNEPAPKLEAEARSLRAPGERVRLSLAEFSPRSRAPRSVRITLRDVEIISLDDTQVTFAQDGALRGSPPPLWAKLAPSDRERIVAAVRDESTDPSGSFNVTLGDRTYSVRIMAGVNWPHAPIADHYLGIDEAGRDVLARILYGLRVSLLFAICLVLVSYSTGIVVGAVQGFCGGTVDLVGQRLIEIWATLPFLYVMMLVGSIFGRGFGVLLVCYAIFNWIGISYYVRAEFLKLRHQPFVDAARVMGLSRFRIMLLHILPNAMTPVITLAPIALAGAIGSLAALDYLGFGLPALTPSLGQLLQQAQRHQWAWWLIAYPSAALFLVLLLSVFVGEGIRKAYDPRPPFNLE